MSVQKAIFPGLFFGILCLIGLTNLLLATPGTRKAAEQGNPPALSEIKGFQRVEKKAETRTDGCTISNKYPQTIQQWCQLIDRYARASGIDPNLVSAIMLQESAGRSDALSRSGAVGLMQVMPRDGKAANFICKNGPCFADRPSSDELYDPETNVAYATRMLSDLLSHYGDLREALRAYGPMDVGYYYADLVIGTMDSYR